MMASSAPNSSLAGVDSANPKRQAMLHFGDDLRRRSRAAGVGPRGLARRTGIDEETILAIENGAQLPASEDDLRRILAAARITPTQTDDMVQSFRDITGLGAAPPPPATGVFISYRRKDQPYFAGRLYDRFAAQFGEGRVFMDVYSIGLGLDFAEELETALGQCAVLVAVIGSNWLTANGPHGGQAPDDPDYVRLEIERALSRGIRVIPVLVDSVDMPTKADLPVELWPLRGRQAQRITNDRFGADCSALMSTIGHLLADEAAG